MARPLTIAILITLALPLPGCGILLAAIMGAAEALNPDPLSSIEILWARDAKTCHALVGGDAMHAVLRGTLSRRYVPASTQPATKTSEADWRVAEDDPAFVSLAGSKERPRSDAQPRWQSQDAARSYYDFNNDCRAELVYEVFGPPDHLTSYVVLPANDADRRWFEWRLGHLPLDWQAMIAARGGRVFALTAADLVRLDLPYEAARESYPYLAPLVFDGTSYLLKLEERFKFDPARSSPPLTFGDAGDDASAFRSAARLTLYRVTEDYVLVEECRLLEQRMESLLGSF